MRNDPTNDQDLIDSRDVIARIADLEADEERTEAEDEELAALTELAEEASGYAPDWTYGETLIRDSYFQTYAQELAEDCCDLPSHDQWPARCIDWAQAARELQEDYTEVDFDGVGYWIR